MEDLGSEVGLLGSRSKSSKIPLIILFLSFILLIISFIFLILIFNKVKKYKDNSETNEKTQSNMTILFVIAMKEEFNHLLSKFKDIPESRLGEYTFYKTESNGKTIYILYSGIGMVNIAISLTKFLNKIKPDIIINAGTSGGHDKSLNVGDVVLAKEAININSLETQFKGINEGSDSLTWKLTTFTEEAEEKDFAGDYEINYGDKKLISKIKDIGINLGITIYEGRVASCDIWNKEIDRINFFNKNYSTLCEEMEIFCVYTISKQENIPSIGIKIISNNEINQQKYDASVCEKLDEFLYKIILDL